jgi:AmiR/NasT family two-component response regulator
VVVTGRAHFAQAAEEAGAMGYAEKPLIGAAIPELLEAARARFEHALAGREMALLGGELRTT